MGNRPSKSLVGSITNRVKLLSTLASLKWGIDNEEQALKVYKGKCADKNLIIKCRGLIVSLKWPWLGCSPDGIVFQNGIPAGCVKVKCPHAKRDNTVQAVVD